MRVKNDYIIIKNGKKETKLHNTILNIYLDQIINNQMELNPDNRASLIMSNVYLKFDTPLTFDKTSVLADTDFDAKISYYKHDFNISPNKIVVDCFYACDDFSDSIWDIENEYWAPMGQYLGKPIMALGFGGYLAGDEIIYACVDTSTYGLYIEAIDEIFSIARRDILETDAIFYTPNNLVDGAVHLFDGQDVYYPNTLWPEYQLIGILDAIGIGVMSTYINIAKTLLPYSSHITIDGQTMDISDEFEIEYNSEGLFPELDLYPATNLYPERVINELYPSEDIYPGIDIYPVEAPYQYLQLKYKIYKQDIVDGTIADTGDYYLLSKPIERKNKIKMNIEYIGA